MKGKLMRFFLILFLVFSSCQKERKSTSLLPPSDKFLRINSATEPPSLDPRKANEHSGIIIDKMLFEGLTRENPDGNAVPALAKRVSVSEDGKTYTFHLKKTKWSNGENLTAYDFEESWKKALHPDFPSQLAYLMYGIKGAQAAKRGTGRIEEVGIRAVGPYLLEVELDHPIPYFAKLVASPIFFPYPPAIAQSNELYFSKGEGSFIGNGPFHLKQWKHSYEMTYSSNPLYWDADRVKLKGIKMSFVSDQNSALEMFEKGELDWIGDPLTSLPEEAMPQLRAQNRIQDWPIAGVYYFIFNTKRFPFTNKKIRQAFSLSIDRKAIIEHVTQKGHKPAMRLIPHVMIDQEVDYFKDGDIALAKKLFSEGLEELGIRLNEFPPISFHYNNTYPLHYKIAQAVQDQWRDSFGIKIDLENREWKVYLEELQNSNFLIARLGGISLYSDPLYFLEYFIQEKESLNYSRWTDPQFKKILQTLSQRKDPEERRSLLLDAETLLMEHMPVAPIFFYNMSQMQQPYVQGVYLSELGLIDFKWVDFVDPPTSL